MWTFGNEAILQPQIWDRLASANRKLTTAAWFPMLSKRCGANYVCMPAPVHNPDGSESMWCYTQPRELYGQLLERLGHFPLQHFWGPLANIQSSKWIAESAAIAAELFRPDFFYIYLPHLDYSAQKLGPDGSAALQAVRDLDALLDSLASRLNVAYAGELEFLVASEYAIGPTEHVTFPNRILRESGLLKVNAAAEGEQLDFEKSSAWAMVDHQLSHIFVRDAQPETVAKVAELFRSKPGIRQVVAGSDRAAWNIDHPRAGDVVLISEPNSWQAYYWWFDDAVAPSFARSVDIHRKPGYDPVELHFDMKTRSIPLDATLVKGSHGIPSTWVDSRPAIWTTVADMFPRGQVVDTEICHSVLRYFGCAAS
jgi:hypothetical protein